MLFEYWCPMCGTQGLVYALDFQYSKKQNHSLVVECEECGEELMLMKPEMENRYVVNLQEILLLLVNPDTHFGKLVKNKVQD